MNIQWEKDATVPLLYLNCLNKTENGKSYALFTEILKSRA